MSEENSTPAAEEAAPTEPTNVTPFPASEPATAEAPASTPAEQVPAESPLHKTVQEVVHGIDITGLEIHDVVHDIVHGIQELAMRATIGLGLVTRIHAAKVAEQADQKEDAPAATEATPAAEVPVAEPAPAAEAAPAATEASPTTEAPTA
jgi:hypothetical protein